MRERVWIVLCAAAVLTTAACQASPETGAVDCEAQVRVGDAVYTSYGYSNQKASKHSVADRAECDDTSANPKGSYFPDSPKQVATWVWKKYASDAVLGVRFNDDTFRVFVADELSSQDRDRILRDLQSGSNKSKAG